MTNILERTLLMGLGVLTLTREKISEAVNELVAVEEVEPEEAPKLVDALVAKGETERQALRDIIRQEVDRLKPVTRKEFNALNQRLDALAERVEQLAEKMVAEGEAEEANHELD
jgi:polyhydroxyalkanoate synthesis regulator phasin